MTKALWIVFVLAGHRAASATSVGTAALRPVQAVRLVVVKPSAGVAEVNVRCLGGLIALRAVIRSWPSVR
jgi:hypothetical protein